MHLCRRNVFGVMWLTLLGLGILVPAAQAAEHLMQIEQLIGGVEGDSTAQAIQLRMRFANQNVLGITRVVARDANGNNPVVICDLDRTYPNFAAGTRILLTSVAFNSKTDIATVSDDTITTPIPKSYFNGGSITFQNDANNLFYWRLAWGGGAYVGPCTGILVANDSDGNMCPAFPGTLPAGSLRSLLYPGPFGGMSTTNAADYVLTDSASVWMNNAGNFFVLVPGDTSTHVDPSWDYDAPVIIQAPFAPNPFNESTRMAFRLKNEALASLLIIDASGRQVARMEERLPAGAHEFSWNGRGVDGSPVSAGRYFYRLNASGESRSGDLILVR